MRNADAQVRLIDDLLDLSRITTGKMRLDVRRVDMPRRAAGRARCRASGRRRQGHSHSDDLDPDAGPVTGDPARLQQVVWNLLMNAVKFTPRGGDVNLRLQRANAHVADRHQRHGSGDRAGDAAARVRAVPAGRQLEHARARRPRARPALVKHLVELHGGTVVAQSDGEGRGATFTVTLPIDRRRRSAPDRRRAMHPSASAGRGAAQTSFAWMACACWSPTTTPRRSRSRMRS